LLYFSSATAVKKILVIDDEEWLREVIHLALKQRGFEVIRGCRRPAMASKKARKELPDLIPLRHQHGKKWNGYLTLTSLRSEAPTAAIPFILMTGLADNTSMKHGMDLGADDYLSKLSPSDALYAVVETRLKEGRILHDEAGLQKLMTPCEVDWLPGFKRDIQPRCVFTTEPQIKGNQTALGEFCEQKYQDNSRDRRKIHLPHAQRHRRATAKATSALRHSHSPRTDACRSRYNYSTGATPATRPRYISMTCNCRGR